MRFARLGLIVSSAVLLTLYSSSGLQKPASSQTPPDMLRVVDHGHGKDVYVTFDRPVVEPEQIGRSAPLEVDVPGLATWAGVAMAVFRPDQPWPPSRTVNVRLRDIQALDGTRLQSPIAWDFRTPGICVEASFPWRTGPRPRFELKFNREIDPAVLARHVSVCQGAQRAPIRVAGLAVEPEAPLPFGSAWRLSIDKALTSRDGASLETDWVHEFQVCPEPALVTATGYSDVAAYNEIRLRFSTPLVDKDLQRRITIRPATEFSSSPSDENVTLTGKFAAGATYWVQIAEGHHDVYGNALGPITATVHIPPYTPSLRFPERSRFVERDAVHAVPLETVNVPKARLVVERLPQEPWHAETKELLVDRWFDANQEPNEIFTHGVTLPGTGRYLVAANAPELKLEEKAVYQVTDLALAFKLGRTQSLACVTSFQTGHPVADVGLSLHDEKGRELWCGTTDENGCAAAPGRPSLACAPRYLLGGTPDDFASLDLKEHELENWRLPVHAQSAEEPEPLDACLWTDRPVYRPGETVQVKAWCRDVGLGRVRLELQDGRGEVIDRVERDLSPGGGVDATFRLAERAWGEFYQVVALANQRKIAKSFQVACYRAPSFEVHIRPTASWYFPGDRVQATIEARTFFGAPLGRAQVEWSAWLAGSREHGEGRGTLDPEGRLTFSHKLGKDIGLLVLKASVTDAAHQSVTTDVSVQVHPAALVIDAQPNTHVAEIGKAFEIPIVVKTLDGARVDRDVSARFIRRTWSHVQQLTAGRGWSFVWEKRDEIVAAEIVRPGKWTVTPSSPGPHVLEFRTRDEADREVLSTVEVDVAGAGEAGWRPRNDFTLDLVPDRAVYRAGETARVLIRNALARSRALVTLEREGVIEQRWIEITSGATVLEIPLHAEHAPNLHLGVLLVRGRTGSQLSPEGDDPQGPRYRYGYATLKLDCTDRRLPVEVSVRPHFVPGEEATLEILTLPGAELTVAVVDEAVLSLVEAADPDPHEFFWSSRPLRVTTSDARRSLAAARPLDLRGKKGRPGGGGGEEEGKGSRRKFVGTAYWNAHLVAGDDGRARTSFRLPDNLTRWRVVVVAAAKGQWGSGRATFRTEKPLMLVSALPRFALLGDSFVARFILHNRSSAGGRARVELDGVARDVEIGAGSSVPVDFPVHADRLGPRRFKARAALDSHEDTLEVVVPVQYPTATETAIQWGRLDGGSDLAMPTMDHVESIHLTLGLNALALMEAKLRHLLDYPHGCVEQTTSKTLPLLALRELGIEGTERFIEAGVHRLLSMQTPSGGLAYWPDASEPNPAGTVYAGHALVLAARAGLSVPRPALGRVLNYIEDFLRDARDGPRSYALYVLALAGRNHEAYLESLRPDPFLALAAIEYGWSERAREILHRPALISNHVVQEFDSDTRSAAVTLLARAKLGEEIGASPYDLLKRAFLTYEIAWTLLALREVVGEAQSSARRVRVLVDGQVTAEPLVTGITRLAIPPGRLRLESDGPVYYSVQVRGHRPAQGAENKGFWVRHTYTRVGETLPRMDFRAGDLVVVRVTLSARADRLFVALEDPLPAGLEPVDLRFRTEDRSLRAALEFEHLERRDDRVFASLERMYPGIYELSYLARATTVGRFVAPAPQAEEMYAPHVRGRGTVGVIVVTPR